MTTRDRRQRDKKETKGYEIDVITDVPAFDVDNYVWVKVELDTPVINISLIFR